MPYGCRSVQAAASSAVPLGPPKRRPHPERRFSQAIPRAPSARSHAKSLRPKVTMLEEAGATLGFPHSSKITASRHSGMRELRVQHAGDPLPHPVRLGRCPGSHPPHRTERRPETTASIRKLFRWQTGCSANTYGGSDVHSSYNLVEPSFQFHRARPKASTGKSSHGTGLEGLEAQKLTGALGGD